MIRKIMIFLGGILLLEYGCLFGQLNHKIMFKQPDNVFNLKTERNGKDYLEIKFPEFQRTIVLGHPDLPFKYVHLLIPPGQNASKIIINKVQSENIKLNNEIIPVQPLIPTSLDYEIPNFVEPDSSIYNSDIFYPPDIVQFMSKGYYDGDKLIVTLAVFPYQYNPKQNLIKFNSSIDFTIVYGQNIEELKPIKNKNRSVEIDKRKLKLLEGLIENKDLIKNYKEAITEHPENLFQTDDLSNNNFATPEYGMLSSGIFYDKEYVIITTSQLAPCFNNFIAHKKRKGVDIGLVTTEDIYANYSGDEISDIYDNPGKIRQFLFDAYSNGLIYVLIGGVNSVVPVRYGTSYNNTWHNNPGDYVYMVPADLYFAEFNGDWNVDNDDYLGEPEDDVQFGPEISVGRILCTSCEEIERWTRKIITYENNPGIGYSAYLTRSFMTQADQLQAGNEAGYVSNYLTDFTHYIYGEQPSYNSPEIPTSPTGNLTLSHINGEFHGLISIFCHGGPCAFACATKGINEYGHDVKYAVASYNAWDEDDNLSYSTIEENKNGLDNMNNLYHPAIAYSVACSNNPFDPDFFRPESELNMGMGWTSKGDGGGPAYLGNTRYGYVTSSSRLYSKFADEISNDNTYHIGEAEVNSKQQWPQHHLALSHNLVGCPETELWTDMPSIFSNVSVTENGSDVTVVTNESESHICVMSAMDNGESYFDDIPATSHTFPNVPKPYLVTVTKHDFIPYFQNPDIYIQNESFYSQEYMYGNNVYIGSNVTPTKPQGPVIINNGSNVVLEVDNNTEIYGDFEVKLGGSFEIKITPYY